MAFFYPYYHIMTIFGMILLLMAAPFHFNTQGASISPYMLWLFIWCLLNTVNGIVWHDRMDNIAPVWCDISNKLRIGAIMGVIAGTLAINRRLYKISCSRSLLVEAKTRGLGDQSVPRLGLGVPVILMALHVVVQGHRGDIVEGLGCVPSTYNVSLAYPLNLVWPLFLSFIAAIYASLSFRAFLRRRNTIDEVFTSGSSISKDHYLRLMCFSLIPLLLMVPLTLFALVVNIRAGPQPWISWEDTHSDFNRFDSYPAAVIAADPYIYASWVLDLWSSTISWVLFTIFLGMGNEQRRQYRRWFFVILQPFGIKPWSSSTESPTVWQRLFGRPTAASRLKSTPSTSGGGSASISTFSVTRDSKAFSKKFDPMSTGRDSFELNDYPGGEIERGTRREGRLKVKAIHWEDHENAPAQSKDDMRKEGYAV